ncbi:MAG: hypothetical protein Q8K48_02100 [Candidatus Planktophila sp.]|nr:hypothetical protein [Candidatus Planktophila sp.]
MKYLNIIAGVIAFTFSTLAWTSKDDYMMYGTIGGFVMSFLILLKVQYLRKHPEHKSE